MSGRKRIVRTQEKAYIPGPDAPRYYGIEWTSRERSPVVDAIAEATGETRMNVVSILVGAAMHEFGEKHGVPYCWTYLDDAYVYLCIELGIDYKQFPHNTRKLPIDEFVAGAKRYFRDLRPARNEMQRIVQRGKLWKLFREWAEAKGFDKDQFVDPDLDAIADEIAALNSSRPKIQPLRIVHSRVEIET